MVFKKVIPPLARSLLSSTVFLAGLFAVPAPVWASWARTFPPQDYLSSLLPAPGGGFVVSAFDPSTTTLVKLDPAGQPEWLKYIEYPGNPSAETQITNGIRLAGGDYLYAVGVSGIPTPQSFLVRIDQSSWTPTWILTPGLGKLLATVDGGFLAGGTGKFTADAVPVWYKVFDLAGSGFSTFNINDFKERTGGTDPGVIIVGSVSPCPPPSNSPEGCAFAASIKDDGSTITWAQFYAELQAFHSVSVTSSGELYLAGRYKDPVMPSYYPWVGRLSDRGVIIWERWYQNGFDHEGGLIAETSTGTVVSLSLFDDNGPSFTFWHILALAHDSGGRLLWQRRYSIDTYTAWNLPILPVTGGGFAIGGLSYPGASGPITAWVMLLDSQGEIDAACSLVGPGSAFEVNGIATPAVFGNFPSMLDGTFAPVRGVLNITDGVPDSNLICSGGCAAPPSVVTLVKGIRSGTDAIFSWMTEPSANGYNLWHVTSKDQIDQARQSTSPPAIPVAGCTPVTGTTCTDSGAVPRSSPATFFYQVRAFCDLLTEGP